MTPSMLAWAYAERFVPRSSPLGMPAWVEFLAAHRVDLLWYAAKHIGSGSDFVGRHEDAAEDAPGVHVENNGSEAWAALVVLAAEVLGGEAPEELAAVASSVLLSDPRVSVADRETMILGRPFR